MSYRNPTQVVDTQTGQAYADLQKTIAGSAGFASKCLRTRPSTYTSNPQKDFYATRKSLLQVEK